MQDSDCSLIGATVAPGFEYEDFEVANAKHMQEKFPQHWATIQHLCKPEE